MIIIQIKDNKFALIDDDAINITAFKWNLKKKKHTCYAQRTTCKNGKKKNILMHREILNLYDSNVIVDHKNGNGLDNRKVNLRICTKNQNQYNSRKRNGISAHKGVHYDKCNRIWIADIMINRKRIRLGRFNNEESAGAAYRSAAKKYHGEFFRDTRGSIKSNGKGDLNERNRTQRRT